MDDLWPARGAATPPVRRGGAVAAAPTAAELLHGPGPGDGRDDDLALDDARAGGAWLLGELATADLEALPPDADEAAILTPAGPGRGSPAVLGATLLDGGRPAAARWGAGSAVPDAATVLGELHLRGDAWLFRAVGQGGDPVAGALATDLDADADAVPPPAPAGGSRTRLHDEAVRRSAERDAGDADAQRGPGAYASSSSMVSSLTSKLA